MSKRNLFGGKIEPACRYCQQGNPSQDGGAVLCEKRGVVLPDYHCRRFVYDPLKREPHRAPPLTQFDPADFQL